MIFHIPLLRFGFWVAFVGFILKMIERLVMFVCKLVIFLFQLKKRMLLEKFIFSNVFLVQYRSQIFFGRVLSVQINE